MNLRVQKHVPRRTLVLVQQAVALLEASDRVDVPGTRLLLVRNGTEAEKNLAALPKEHLRLFEDEAPDSTGQIIKYVVFTK